MQSLGAAVSELNVNSRYVDFVKKEMKFKTSNRKRINQESNKNVIKMLSKLEEIEEKEIIEAINKKFRLARLIETNSELADARSKLIEKENQKFLKFKENSKTEKVSIKKKHKT